MVVAVIVAALLWPQQCLTTLALGRTVTACTAVTGWPTFSDPVSALAELAAQATALGAAAAAAVLTGLVSLRLRRDR